MLSKLIFLFICLFQSAAARNYSYSVKGQLTCRGEPYDGLDFISADDLMGIKRTGPTGMFYVDGYEDEWWEPSPYLKLYHRCGHEELKPNCFWVERLPPSNRLKVVAVTDNPDFERMHEKEIEHLGKIELYKYNELHKVDDNYQQCVGEEIKIV